MTLREALDETIQIYNKALSITRYNMARESNGTVKEVPNVDEAMRVALKAININNKDDLATAFKQEGIEYSRLTLIQTPYLEKKVETEEEIKKYGKGAYRQVENTVYAQPYKGFGFDDVYAIEKMFEVLPENKDNYGFYREWSKAKDEYRIEQDKLITEEKELDEKIKEFFSYSNWIFGWTPYKSGISVGDIQERVEMRRSLAKMIDEKNDLEPVEKTKLLIKWYFDNAEGNPNVNLYRNEIKREYIA